MKAYQTVFLSAEWSGKLQALLETHAPIPKLQPMRGPVKPSDAADPSNFGMIRQLLLLHGTWSYSS